MSENVFLDTLQKVIAAPVPVGQIIDAAVALTGAGRPDLSKQIYRLWWRLNPADPHAHVAMFNCAVLESDTGDLAAAIDLLQQVVASTPDFLPPYINLGSAYDRAGMADKAVETWKALAARLGPVTGHTVEMKVMALKQIGRVFADHHEGPLTELSLKESLDILPEQRDVIEQYVATRLGLCLWPVMAVSERISRKTLLSHISPLSAAAFADDPVMQLANAARYVEQAVPDQPDCPFDRRHAPIDLTGRRLRVGYVSSDLRDHAIGYLMAELFELHDREKIEVFAYYCGVPPQGAQYERIRDTVEHFVDIREMTDDQAARRIGEDGIDILVDVNGHTRDARSALFARRPAPIIVNWLGYPGSMGTPYHHYIIADDWIVPPGSERYYSEKVLRLPCYQPNDRRRLIAPERPTRAEVGLPEDAFVFCSFNGVQKLTRFQFLRWLEILRETPGSVLWLLDPGAVTHQRLGDFAEQHGVARDRIVLATKLANPFHLARYPLADLFLDSFPYGAHTTASDALWMGVPLLTFSGRSFASRVCGSLLRAAGAPELVCDSPESFVRRAIELGRDRAATTALKAKLAATRESCDLFNMEKLTASLEALYGEMCADHAAGRLPKPDLANLDVYHKLAVEDDHETLELIGVADYDAYWRSKLAHRHQVRPVRPDDRLWTAADAAGADGEVVDGEGATAGEAAPARKRGRSAAG